MTPSNKREEGDLILVTWLDQSYYTGPMTRGDSMFQSATGKTLGYFVEENKDWLCVAMEQFETDRISYRHIVTFPKVAILKIQKVSLSKKN